MSTPIHPEALKAGRARKQWTQEQLVDATRGKDQVSLPTIKRIEGAKEGTYQANKRVASAIAKALGIDVETLSKPPTEDQDREQALRKFGYRPLRTMIDAETALAFNVVQHVYGIPVRTQIEMAPLFAALLAEGSLAWRKKRVEEIEEASQRLQDLGGGHNSYVFSAWRVDDGTAAERESIAKLDLFGVEASEQAFDCGYDRSVNNPFADYIEELARQTEAATISFDKDFGWKTSEGLPKYRIASDVITGLTGDDPDAEYALLRGHVKLKDIPEELLGDDKAEERIAWMIASIPDDELSERQAERDELLALIGLDKTSEPSATSNESKGGENA